MTEVRHALFLVPFQRLVGVEFRILLVNVRVKLVESVMDRVAMDGVSKIRIDGIARDAAEGSVKVNGDSEAGFVGTGFQDDEDLFCAREMIASQ